MSNSLQNGEKTSLGATGVYVEIFPGTGTHFTFIQSFQNIEVDMTAKAIYIYADSCSGSNKFSFEQVIILKSE